MSFLQVNLLKIFFFFKNANKIKSYKLNLETLKIIECDQIKKQFAQKEVWVFDDFNVQIKYESLNQSVIEAVMASFLETFGVSQFEIVFPYRIKNQLFEVTQQIIPIKYTISEPARYLVYKNTYKLSKKPQFKVTVKNPNFNEKILTTVFDNYFVLTKIGIHFNKVSLNQEYTIQLINNQ